MPLQKFYRICVQLKIKILSVDIIVQLQKNVDFCWLLTELLVTLVLDRYCLRCTWPVAVRSTWWTSSYRVHCFPYSCCLSSVFLLTRERRSQSESPCCWRSPSFYWCWPTVYRERRSMCQFLVSSHLPCVTFVRNFIIFSGVTPIGQGWTNARGLRSLGGPKPDLKSESVHVITCCMLPNIHFCVFTVIEIAVIY